MLTRGWPRILYTCIVVFIGGVVQYEQSPTRWHPLHAAAVVGFCAGNNVDVLAMLVYGAVGEDYVVHRNKHIEYMSICDHCQHLYLCFVDSLRYPIYPPGYTRIRCIEQPLCPADIFLSLKMPPDPTCLKIGGCTHCTIYNAVRRLRCRT